ncbi:MAG TPA: membrane dipeptidase [Clostridiales bacterium]|nr:membrane dipeptidase [Clostridiales bacterium]
MIPLFDCHCDTISRVMTEGGSLRKNGFHTDLERLHKFAPCAQVFAVCAETLDRPVEKADAMLRRLSQEIEENSDIVMLCLNFHDIKKAAESGKVAVFISIEGCEQISSLESAYQNGVRILHPTWNFDNELCGAAVGSGRGLTEKGRAFVKKAQHMGFALDMSHISERGFWDTLEACEKPVIAGHSNAKALCNVPRNLTDEQFNALVDVGGGAGINLYPEFLGLGKDINAVIAHIEHFLSLGGERSVFLGCDFDGIDSTPTGLDGVHKLDKLYNELLNRNYPEALVRALFWDNLYDIMEKIL